MSKNLTGLIARILLATLFIIAGWGKLTAFGATATMMAGKGLPMTHVLLVLTIIIELGGGLLLVLGFYARAAALIMCLFTLVVTFVFHAFWAVPEAQASLQQLMFLKNMAIMGGLLLLTIHGPGAWRLSLRR